MAASRSKKHGKVRKIFVSILVVLLVLCGLALIFNEQIKSFVVNHISTTALNKPISSSKPKKGQFNYDAVRPVDTKDVAKAATSNAAGSIGKIANRLRQDGKKVVVAAADTFRAAAVEQLEIWANRAGCDIVKRQEGVDPASVVYDAIKITKENNADVLICDTAGRLHNKKNLMDELIKIKRVIDKELPNASEEVLMVLDATTGQNAILQVQAFKEAVDITGIILTKLDGTAKGGAVIGIVNENKVPVKFIGVGEKIDDMEIFNSEDFVKALI